MCQAFAIITPPRNKQITESLITTVRKLAMSTNVLAHFTRQDSSFLGSFPVLMPSKEYVEVAITHDLSLEIKRN